MKEVRMIKKEGFKNAYRVEEESERELSKEHYNNITSNDTMKWFRRLGGNETATRNYTCLGYLVVKLVSYSPNREIKVIREFKFND
jgi:hypothetical protein